MSDARRPHLSAIVEFRGVDVLTARVPRSLLEDAAREAGVGPADLHFDDRRAYGHSHGRTLRT